MSSKQREVFFLKRENLIFFYDEMQCPTPLSANASTSSLWNTTSSTPSTDATSNTTLTDELLHLSPGDCLGDDDPFLMLFGSTSISSR